VPGSTSIYFEPGSGDGRVGIGTTSPNAKLDVAGSIRSSLGGSWASSAGGVQITYDGVDTGTMSMYYDAQDLVLGAGVTNKNGITISGTGADNKISMKAGGSDRVTVLGSSGNVGIGTASPQAKLHLNSGSDNGILLENGNAILGNTGSGYTELLYWSNGNAYYGRQTNSVPGGVGGSVDSHSFRTGGQTRLIIDSSGDVGIGTTSPSEKLHVDGNVKVTGTTGSIELLSNSAATITLANGGGTSPSPTLNFFRQAGVSAFMQYDVANKNVIIQNSYTTADTAGNIQFKTRGNNTRMHVAGDGNVGIGTASPSEKLEVAGNVILDSSDARIKIKGGVTGTNSGIDWTFNTDTTQYARIELDYDTRNTTGLLIDSGYPMTLDYSSGAFSVKKNGTSELTVLNGNVGIGTTSPTQTLHVGDGSIDGTIRSVYTDGSYVDVHGYGLYMSRNASYIRPTVDNTQTLYIGSTDHTWSTVPINASTFSVSTDTTEHLRVNSTGNVGIGTTTPASPLHVYSNNAITGTSGGLTIEQDGTGDALLQFLLTGTKRWVVGIDNDNNNNFKISGTSDLGTDNGLTITNGTYNVGIGTESPSAKLDVVGLVNINDGSNNVMISSRNTAMAASSGSNNTAVGDVAGFTNASGNNNSFFGRATGYYSTGYNNVLLGMEAGYGGATSTYSNTVAVGYQALYDLTTGAGNTAVGYQASTNISYGNNNTSVGFQAGYAITSGSSNSFFGTYAGVSTTGSENTAVGHSASFSNTTGTNNVAIGRGAGYTNSTGSRNIFIGYQAGYNETGSDKLYINNSSGSNPLIYGDFNLRTATINGDLTVSSGNLRADAVEINGRALAATPAAGEYGAGSRLVTQFASGTVTAGKVYVANAGSWAEGDANAGSTSIGMIAVATDSASAAEMLIEGVVKLSSNTGFSGAAEGTVLYLSTTAGELTTTAPSTAGEYVRVCGYVVKESTNEVFFSPSRDWTAL
jgi:hypothetical protein